MKNYFRLYILFLCFIFHFLFSHAQNDWLWAKYGKGNGIVSNITIDNSGNCLLTGAFDIDSMQFGSHTLINNNNYQGPEAFLVKYDQKGNLIWANQSSGNNTNPLNGYVSSTDEAGNVYMTATFADSDIFGSYILHTSSIYADCSFIVKYDPNGNILWAKQSTIPTEVSGVISNFISTDANGNSYLTGFFIDTAIFENDTLYFGSHGNTFLVKYNTNGNVIWAKESKSKSYSSNAEVFGETLDKHGNIYLTGRFVDTISLSIDTLIGPYFNQYNNYAFFLTKYDSSGNVKWAKQTKVPSIFCEGWGYADICDQYGNIYVAGEFTDTLIFDNDTLISNCNANNTNIFVVKYDSNGKVMWVKQSSTQATYGASTWAISSDTIGHIYVSGGIGNKNPVFIIDNDTMKTTDTSYDDEPSFLLKIDTSGKLLCGNIFPYAIIGNEANSIASNPSGNYVYYAGETGTIAIYGQDTIDPLKYRDVFPIIARWEECDPSLEVINMRDNIIKIVAYPNPNNGNFTLSLQGISEKTQITIYNILGEQVYQTSLNSTSAQIDIGNKAEGPYLYRVTTETGKLVGEGKLIINK